MVCASVLCTAYAMGSGSGGNSIPVVIESGSGVETASYIIYKDGDYTCLKNGSTGRILTRGSDASTVIQEGIELVSGNQTAGGGTLHISEGEYVIKDTLIISAGSRYFNIIGEYGTRLSLDDAANCNFFNITTSSHFTIKGLKLYGNNDNNDNSIGIYIDRCIAATISEISIYNCSSHGIYIYDTAGGNSATTIYLSSIYVNEAEGRGIYLYKTRGISVQNCVVESGMTAYVPGLDILQSNGIVVNNLWSEYNAGYGMQIKASNGVSLTGAVFTENKNSDIVIETSDAISIISSYHKNTQNKAPVNCIATSSHVTMISCDFTDSNGVPADSGKKVTFLNCAGYSRENSGVATILSGATFVEVAHGLSAQPTVVYLSSGHAECKTLWWVNVNATHIRIYTNQTVTGNRAVGWTAMFV